VCRPLLGMCGGGVLRGKGGSQPWACEGVGKAPSVRALPPPATPLTGHMNRQSVLLWASVCPHCAPERCCVCSSSACDLLWLQGRGRRRHIGSALTLTCTAALDRTCRPDGACARGVELGQRLTALAGPTEPAPGGWSWGSSMLLTCSTASQSRAESSPAHFNDPNASALYRHGPAVHGTFAGAEGAARGGSSILTRHDPPSSIIFVPLYFRLSRL